MADQLKNYNAKEVIDEERSKLELKGKEQPVGLAFSGGGIRSASFAIGVMQALNEGPGPEVDQVKSNAENKSEKKVTKLQLKLAESFHYLSSVSGGGYVGLGYSWLRRGKGKDFFPFANDEKRDGISGNMIMKYLSHHGKFLTPTRLLNLLALIGVIFRGAFISASFYFSLLTFIMALAIYATFNLSDSLTTTGNQLLSCINIILMKAENIGGIILVEWGNLLEIFSQKITNEDAANKIPIIKPFKDGFYLLGVFITVLSALGFLALIILNLFIKFILQSKPVSDYINNTKYSLEVFTTIWGGYFLKLLFFGLIVAIIPLGHKMLEDAISILGPIGLIIGIITAILQFRRNASKKPLLAGFPITGNASAVIGAAIFILLILIFSFHLAHHFIKEYNHGIINYTLLIFVILSMTILGWLNINYSAIGRFYRDRLMETFMPSVDAIKANKWVKSHKADNFALHSLNFNKEKTSIIMPYNLANANIVLTDSEKAKYRSRNGDSFLFSSLYVGSDATGYVSTKKFMDADAGKRGMTVSTAMAISGAAVNPNADSGGKGVIINPLISTIMTFFNIRLGYWAPNPCENKISEFMRGHNRANFINPGIYSILGLNLDERDRFVELTDGGHFENLGIYELIRRRCKLIIVSDAGADPEFKFAGLTTALKKVRADFGCNIRFKIEDLDISNLIPGSAETKPPVLGDLFKTAIRGYALGTIDYSPDPENPTKELSGTILYLKTTITPGLPADLYGYKAAHPKFPDEPTSDQFFSERQFESYRELGYQITYAALTNETVVKAIKSKLKKPETKHE